MPRAIGILEIVFVNIPQMGFGIVLQLLHDETPDGSLIIVLWEKGGEEKGK